MICEGNLAVKCRFPFGLFGRAHDGCICIKKENVKYFNPATSGIILRPARSSCDQRDHPGTSAIILRPARSSCDQRDPRVGSLELVH